ncbi:MAG: hypothetical protein ACKO1F_13045 [Flammeovirgaceae bacterium]
MSSDLKFFLFFVLLVPHLGLCQRESTGPSFTYPSVNGILTDLKGEPIKEGSTIVEDGSPFFNPEWTVGDLLLSNGTRYVGVFVKINLYSDRIHYQSRETKAESVAGEGIVHEIELKDPTKLDPIRFRCQYPSIDKHDTKTFYQVLTDGKVQLLKQIKKIFIEEKAFNSATVTRRFDTDKSYYYFKDGKMVRLKRTKQSVLEALADQKGAVEEFMSSNKLSIRSDQDLVKIFSFYNSL